MSLVLGLHVFVLAIKTFHNEAKEWARCETTQQCIIVLQNPLRLALIYLPRNSSNVEGQTIPEAHKRSPLSSFSGC